MENTKIASSVGDAIVKDVTAEKTVEQTETKKNEERGEYKWKNSKKMACMLSFSGT
jgi:hypothetical protein